MDANGFYPAHGCRRCGTPLQGQGSGRPAELYAGTYTGLCYPCTSKPGPLDEAPGPGGSRLVSFPPPLPSHRRDRVQFVAFGDCLACGGAGSSSHYVEYRDWYGRPCSGVNHREQCRPCEERAHPELRSAREREELRKELRAELESLKEEGRALGGLPPADPARLSYQRRFRELTERSWKEGVSLR